MKALNLRLANLADIKGTSFAAIESKTVVTLKGGKGNPYQGRIVKVAKQQIMLFGNKFSNAYENKVNRNLVAEGKEPSFKAQAASWGEKQCTGIVEHKGQHYLEFIKIKEKAAYFLDGERISYDTLRKIEGYEVPKGGEQGGATKKVQFRRVKLENVTYIAANRCRMYGPFEYKVV